MPPDLPALFSILNVADSVFNLTGLFPNPDNRGLMDWKMQYETPTNAPFTSNQTS
jgi:hypothetical protein